MLVPDPAQATAVRDWLLLELNTDDLGDALSPAPFDAASVFLGDRDHGKLARFARIATVSIVGHGLCRRHVASDVGDPGQALTEERWEHLAWTTSITVCSRLTPTAPVMSDAASVHLRRALGAREGEATAAMALQGVTFLRGTDMADTGRIAGGTTWETRATATITWLCGWRGQRSIGWVDRVLGTGATTGLTPLAFDTGEPPDAS